MRLLRRLGRGEDRPNRRPGKIILSRGVRRRVNYLPLEAILTDERQHQGGFPQRIAASSAAPLPLSYVLVSDARVDNLLAMPEAVALQPARVAPIPEHSEGRRRGERRS